MAEAKVFDASLAMQRIPISTWSLASTLLRFPLMTLQVIVGIHWQALRLWLKGARLLPRPVTAVAKADTLPVGEGNQYARLALPARAKALWSGGDRN